MKLLDQPFDTPRGQALFQLGRPLIQGLSDTVAWATEGEATDFDRALALWRFAVGNLYEFLAVEEGDPLAPIGDAVRLQNVYGFGSSAQLARSLCALWRAANLSARIRSLVGHDTTEVFLQGQWRWLDPSVCFYCLLPETEQIAGVDDLFKNPGLIESARATPFGMEPQRLDQVKGWFDATRRPEGAPRLNDWSSSMPVTFRVSRHETFRRLAGAGGRFLLPSPLPDSFKSCLKEGPAPFAEDFIHTLRDMGQGFSNGYFETRYDFGDDGWMEKAMQIQNLKNALDDRGGSCLVPENPAEPGIVTLRFWSPFVLAGQPNQEDEKAPALGGVLIDGRARRKNEDDALRLEISTDNANWETLWEPLDIGPLNFKTDATHRLQGSYQFFLRITLKNGTARPTEDSATVGAALSCLFETLEVRRWVQISPFFFPAIDGTETSEFQYLDDGMSAMYLMPALHRGEKTYQALREQERNIKLTGGPVRLVPLDAQQEGWTQYGIETPGPMQEFEWAVQFAAPAKHPDRRLPLFRILVSLNQGKTWKQASLKGVQLDDGGAMQWSCGRLKITGENIRRLHVRVAVQARGVPETGIAKMEFFAHYRDPYAYRHPVLITHVFEETGQEYRPQAEAESGCTTKTYAVPLVNPDSDFIHNRCIEIAIP